MDETRGAADDAAEVGAWLRLIVGRIARKVRQAKDNVGDVTLPEASVLARLDRDGPDSPGSLATGEGVRPQAMATTLAGLEERGLVSRRQDSLDGRRAVMSVTDIGRKVVADRRSVIVLRLATVLEKEFSPAERARIRGALPLLDRLAERL